MGSGHETSARNAGIICKSHVTYENPSRGARATEGQGLGHGSECSGRGTIEGTMASYNRSTSAPAVESSAGEASIDGFPPVLVLYHPSMEMLARNIVDATIARTKKLSLSEASCINACSY